MIEQLMQVEEILSDLNAPVEWGVGVAKKGGWH